MSGQEKAPFDRVAFNQQLTSMAIEWQKAKSDKNNLAEAFRKTHNETIAAYPDNADQILQTTHRIAGRFGIRYILSGNEMTQAQLTREHPVAAPREVFMVVEEMPRFPGCEEMRGTVEQKRGCADERMLDYLYSNLQYPAKAKELQVEGRTIAQFVVEPDGTITQIEVIRGLGYGCDEEVIRIIQSMNDMDQHWIPGRQRGIAVPVQYTLPILFRLTD